MTVGKILVFGSFSMLLIFGGSIVKQCLAYIKKVMLWAREDHRIMPFAQCGAERSVRLLLTKNPACSFSYPLSVTRYLV